MWLSHTQIQEKYPKAFNEKGKGPEKEGSLAEGTDPAYNFQGSHY